MLVIPSRASRCLSHATICGAGVAVFLLIRVCTYIHIKHKLTKMSFLSFVRLIANRLLLCDLNLQRTTVVLQRSLRESSWPSPYLDAFGEEVKEYHK